MRISEVYLLSNYFRCVFRKHIYSQNILYAYFGNYFKCVCQKNIYSQNILNAYFANILFSKYFVCLLSEYFICVFRKYIYPRYQMLCLKVHGDISIHIYIAYTQLRWSIKCKIYSTWSQHYQKERSVNIWNVDSYNLLDIHVSYNLSCDPNFVVHIYSISTCYLIPVNCMFKSQHALRYVTITQVSSNCKQRSFLF